ncbi:MAG: TRAP transporter small permease [Usitatibacter sp.]
MATHASARKTSGPGAVLHRLTRARHVLFQGLEFVVFVLVIAILTLVATQVFTRYVLHVPVNWLEEAARMALVWLVMIGAAVAAERKEHYLIDIILRMLPARLALVTLTLTNILGIGFLLLLAVTGYAYVRSGMSATYVSLNVPRGYIYLAIPIGSVLMIFSLVSQSIEAWLGRGSAQARE